MITVINMIPRSLSGETNQDSEPSLAVNPEHPAQIAAAAFTPDPLGGSLAPIFVSGDGGASWSLNAIVPGSGPFGTGDIALRFGGTKSRLYAAILRGDVRLRMNILRTKDYASPTPMTILVSRDDVDQPFLEAATVASGPGANRDRVYVGNNDFASGVPGRTATVDRSLSAANAAAPAGFAPFVIEARPTGAAGQDGPQVRTAIHPDGTIYSVFYHWTNFTFAQVVTSDVVIVRDDNWGIGATPFAALIDLADMTVGRRVVTDVTFTWSQVLGQQRHGGSLAIAVDPADSGTVYLAWGDVRPASASTLHVTRSTDRGRTWSADLRTVGGATNGALAVNGDGRLGFLYQQLRGGAGAQRWVTHFERIDPVSGAVDDAILATTPANTPPIDFHPYLGDYLGLQAVGRDFAGVFSASNQPDAANFPSGVTYQRNANFTTRQLLDVDGATPVAVSIDPYFFRATPDA